MAAEVLKVDGTDYRVVVPLASKTGLVSVVFIGTQLALLRQPPLMASDAS